MKWRILFIFVILVLRFFLGYLDSSKFSQNDQVEVTGNIDNIYQNNTKCIIVLGRFWIDYRGTCSFSRNVPISVVGTVNSNVIDRFLGRLWLDRAELAVSKKPASVVSSQNIFSSFMDLVREKSVSVYRQYLPEPESGLVAGIVLGYKNDIGQDMYNMMVNSSTIHIAVASGYNIMLVGGTVLSICFWFMKRKWASIVAILAMIFYAVEAGGEPPVTRAVIMGAVVFVAAIVGRKTISWWILLVSAWIMILIEPLLIFNVSFQLTMAASVGLMVIEPALTKVLSRSHEKLVEILGGVGIMTTLSTLFVTTPIIWWNFGRMSWIGILSNILILPLVPMLMITGSLMQVLPWVFSWPTYALAHWMVEMIRFFGS